MSWNVLPLSIEYSNSPPRGLNTSIVKSSLLDPQAIENVGSGGKSIIDKVTVAWSQTDVFGAGRQTS